MQIVFINRFYRPDHSATSQMLTDLAEYLASEGLQVRVLTSRLSYEGGSMLPANEHLEGVEVNRVWTTQFGRAWLPGRAIDYATFYLTATLTMCRYVSRNDIMVVLTDPPLISIPAAIVARIKGVKLVNWVQDLFPEVAEALGMQWASEWPGRLLMRLRNWSFRQARFNVALHQKMAERFESANIKNAQVRVLPNWADRNLRSVPHQDNPLRELWGLEGKFVIGYSGNLGRAHMPEKVAELVCRTKDISGLVWLFIGGGIGIVAVASAARGADNVIFKPYQSRENLSESLSVADAHLISLDPGCEGLIVPSKYYGVAAVARPVLYLGDADGAVAREIKVEGKGVTLTLDGACNWERIVRDFMVATQSERQREIASSRSEADTGSLPQWRCALAEVGAANG